MKRRFPIFAAAAFLTVILFAGAASAVEVIQRYDQLVRLSKDGTLTVTETIRVRAEGAQIKRGIYREFPLMFEDRDKKLREVTFRVTAVTRDGKPEPYFTRKQGNNIRIYAGEENVLLRPGSYTYQFTYETGRQIRWFEGKPELYWNVTGNAWNFTIERASVRVELPGVSPERWTAYTGRYGEQGKDWRGQVGADNALVVDTTRSLPPAQGFTIVAAYPQGAINPPSAAQQLWYNFLDYRNWILAGAGFLLVSAFYFWAWLKVGRDPKGGTIIPLFYPPKNISPALAAYIYNWGLGGDKWRAFTASALSLAVRGMLLFDNKDGKLTLRSIAKTPDGRASLPPAERAIFTWVTSEGGNAEITRANGKAVKSVGDDFQEAIEGEGKNKFFRLNLGYNLAGIALTIASVLAVIFLGGLQETDFGLLIFMMFISVFLGAFVIPLLRALFGALSGHFEVARALKLLFVLGFIGFVISKMLSVVWASSIALLPAVLQGIAEHPFPFVLVSSFAMLNGMFLYLMRAPTAVGRPLMDQIAGFRMYLETAESPRLNTGAPEITAERFEQILPYAVALDVEKPWSNAFAAALQKAYPNDDPSAHYQPRWNTGGNWSGGNFGNVVSSTVAATSSALASAIPPSSSGSSGFSSGGGGGGSGGGGGGGGGGGW